MLIDVVEPSGLQKEVSKANEMFAIFFWVMEGKQKTSIQIFKEFCLEKQLNFQVHERKTMIFDEGFKLKKTSV